MFCFHLCGEPVIDKGKFQYNLFHFNIISFYIICFDYQKYILISIGMSLPLLLILIQILWEKLFGTYDIFLQDCLQEYASKSVSMENYLLSMFFVSMLESCRINMKNYCVVGN